MIQWLESGKTKNNGGDEITGDPTATSIHANRQSNSHTGAKLESSGRVLECFAHPTTAYGL